MNDLLKMKLDNDDDEFIDIDNLALPLKKKRYFSVEKRKTFQKKLRTMGLFNIITGNSFFWLLDLGIINNPDNLSPFGLGMFILGTFGFNMYLLGCD